MGFGRLSFVATAVLAVAVAFAIGALSWDQDRLPDGFMASNGRIEAKQVEIAPKTAGRRDRALAAEGAPIETGDILAEMDTGELKALLDRANAEIALARQGEAEAEAIVLQRQSELRLAEHGLERAHTLVASDRISGAMFEEREMARDVAKAVLGAAQARGGDGNQPDCGCKGRRPSDCNANRR